MIHEAVNDVCETLYGFYLVFVAVVLRYKILLVPEWWMGWRWCLIMVWLWVQIPLVVLEKNIVQHGDEVNIAATK